MDMACSDDCGRLGDKKQKNSILYNILKNDNDTESQTLCFPGIVPPQQSCSCGSLEKVTLLCPQITCNAASTVMLKTLKFVKNVPCFRELPTEDQMLLMMGSWAQLLVLGMAQDGVDFEITEAPKYSMLQSILINQQHDRDSQQKTQVQGVPLSDIRVIKSFLRKCWDLDVRTKEYAYLKGALLFNPDVVGLRFVHYTDGLRREAHQALNEYVRRVHPEDSARSAKLFITLSLLRSINSSIVAELFFKPIIGTMNMEQLLFDIIYVEHI